MGRYRLLVILAMLLSITACTGSPSRHPGSQAAGGSPGRGWACECGCNKSPLASAFSSLAVVDWSAYAEEVLRRAPA